jgi:hypothetical protein
VEVGVAASAALDDVVRQPVLHDPPVLEHQDAVGDLDRGQPVRDDHRRPGGQDGAQGALHEPLRGHVERAGGLVEVRTAGSARSARAKATSCRWPAESRPPLFATFVS